MWMRTWILRTWRCCLCAHQISCLSLNQRTSTPRSGWACLKHGLARSHHFTCAVFRYPIALRSGRCCAPEHRRARGCKLRCREQQNALSRSHQRWSLEMEATRSRMCCPALGQGSRSEYAGRGISARRRWWAPDPSLGRLRRRCGPTLHALAVAREPGRPKVSVERPGTWSIQWNYLPIAVTTDFTSV